MRNLGVPPTVNQLDTQYTTDFLKTLAERHSYYSGTTNPTASQIPNKQWIVFKNTTNGEVRLWTNDNGTLKSVLLAANSSQPAFSAYQAVGQSIPTSSTTKVICESVEYDYGTQYSSVLGRYTPQVAGVYQVNAAVSISGFLLLELNKNGVLYRRGNQASLTEGLVSTSVLMNGTTDYLEIAVLQTSGAPQNTNAVSSPFLTYFNACLVRPA